MTAALDIAAQGLPVHLFEKDSQLGGYARNFDFKEDGVDAKEFINGLIQKVENCPKITVYKNAEVKAIPGFVGNFTVQLADGKEVPVGAILFAVGAGEYVPTEYGYGSNKNVKTQHEAEKELAEGNFSGKDVVFIQCVGSRNDKVAYCSRVCCAASIRPGSSSPGARSRRYRSRP